MTASLATPPAVDATTLPRLLTAGADHTLASHVARWGSLPAGGDLVAAVTAAGLRGRGGAAFSTGIKLAAVASSGRRGVAPVIVANGTEGEPLSRKDRALLSSNPHIVIDGMVAVGFTLGASRAVLCVKRGQPALVASLRNAIAERPEPIAIEVVETPDRYVSGQETALVHWLNGGDARPTFGRRPGEAGVGGRPTLVDNVETLAHVGLIARFGPEWYRCLGTDDEPGTTLVTVTGGVEHPGVYEIPTGWPVATVLERAGAGAHPVGAVLFGGYFGRWVPARDLVGARLSNESLASCGARLGAGVIAVIPADCCALAEVAAIADWYAANSAGQCGACLFGLADIAKAVHGVHAGEPGAEAAARRWTAMVRGRGACQYPDGAAGFVDSALDTFAGEVAAHRQGRCGLPYRRYLPAPTGGSWR